MWSLGKPNRLFWSNEDKPGTPRYPWEAGFQLVRCPETQKLAYSMAFGRLPTLGL